MAKKVFLVEVPVENCLTMEQLGERLAAEFGWSKWNVTSNGKGWSYTNSHGEICQMDYTGRHDGDSELKDELDEPIEKINMRLVLDVENLVWGVSNGKMIAMLDGRGEDGVCIKLHF